MVRLGDLMLYFRFLSTPSGWRATTGMITAYDSDNGISIHALRVEGDLPSVQPSFVVNISIHALRVEGDNRYPEQYDARFEISIHALRVEGDTVLSRIRNDHRKISIHALRVEGDYKV